ncbi:hypothetical protein CEXT_132401 [Caerostris extrusa]|uniref:Uncharacterized protein n=1 Tax=Caerostris extrusa TaxID=172846 RepID=A0AAV4UA82_CAEEX|nr:hypothetical protein CEXT_132401 [Caerostris extrusa]
MNRTGAMETSAERALTIDPRCWMSSTGSIRLLESGGKKGWSVCSVAEKTTFPCQWIMLSPPDDLTCFISRGSRTRLELGVGHEECGTG